MSGPVVTQILPCPFCGGEAQWRWHSGDALWIECDGCGAIGPQHEGTTDKNSAKTLAAWNARASTAPLIAAMEAAAGIIRRYRDETPPGHSPHMICHEADEVMEQLTAQIEAARKGE